MRWAAAVGADRARVVLVVLVVAVVAQRVALYPTVAGAPPYGDQTYYLDAARALSNLVRDLVSFTTPDGPELRRHVVGNGWFMPGISVLLTPLLVVVPDASIELVRAWLGVVTTALLLHTARVVRRHLGDVAAGAVLVVPGLVPMYAVFGFAVYGDLVAGLVVVLLLVVSLDLVGRARAGDPVTWRHGARLGLLAIVAVYCRSSVAVLVAAVLVTTLAAAVALGRAQWRRTLLATVSAGAVFVVVLAPWSVAASLALGDRVVTTTSVPIVLANTFGDRDEVCLGACDPGTSMWEGPLRYSREVARETGASEVEVATEMSAYARRDVTPHSYARDVLGNLARYLGNPAGFAGILASPTAPYSTTRSVRVVTDVMVLPAFAVGLAMLLVVVRREPLVQVRAVLLKVAIGALLVQPFVHVGGSRYWTTLGPLLGLAAALLHDVVRRRGRDPGAAPHPWLTGLQVAGVAGVALIAAVVVGLAL